MGKKQPKINYIKSRKPTKNSHSSKKSKRSNNYSKRSKKKFTNYPLNSALNSKKSSKKRYFENSSKYKKRSDITRFQNIYNQTNITNNNNFYQFNYFCGLPQHQEIPVWMSESTEKIKDNKIRFNQEIMDYVNYITPKDDSFSRRTQTKNILKHIIDKKRPEWEVHQFGSFEQGTSTIFSDLDFEIIIDKNSSRKRDIDELFYIMKILKNNAFSNNIRLIRARVPILKAKCETTQIDVDISVNRHNGYQAADLIKKIISKYPILKPVIIILKILLMKDSLNEACSGGMSSFLLFHLVFYYFLMRKKEIYSSQSDWEEKPMIDSIRNTLFNRNNKQFIEDHSDSNSKNSESNSNNGFTVTKAALNSDEDYNSNEEDSNIIKNGTSSNYSDYEQKNDSKECMFDNKTKFSTVLNSSDEDNNNSMDKNELDNEDEEEDVEILTNTKLLPEKKIITVDFLLNFLYYFGYKFDYDKYGLKVTENETYGQFAKADRNGMDFCDYICVESIQEPEKDIGKNCYKYKSIIQHFQYAYNMIKAHLNHNTMSILQALGFPNEDWKKKNQ